MEIVFELLDKKDNVLFKGKAVRDGYCYMGEFARPWGWTLDEDNNLVIIFSNLISETQGNRQYVCKLPESIDLDSVKYLRILQGMP